MRMTRKQRPPRTLPIEGLPLREVVMEGNGKLSMVTIKAADGRDFRFGVSDFLLRIATRGFVKTEVHALDDITFRIRYSAENLVLKRAQIDYPGTEDNWKADVETFKGGTRMSWGMSSVDFELEGTEGAAP